jgi:hypothetical protein
VAAAVVVGAVVLVAAGSDLRCFALTNHEVKVKSNDGRRRYGYDIP